MGWGSLAPSECAARPTADRSAACWPLVALERSTALRPWQRPWQAVGAVRLILGKVAIYRRGCLQCALRAEAAIV